MTVRLQMLGGGNPLIQTTQRVFSNAGILALPLMPIEIIPSPGPNRWINVLQTFIAIKFGSTILAVDQSYMGFYYDDGGGGECSCYLGNDVAGGNTSLSDFFDAPSLDKYIELSHIQLFNYAGGAFDGYQTAISYHFLNDVLGKNVALFADDNGTPWAGGDANTKMLAGVTYTIESLPAGW